LLGIVRRLQLRCLYSAGTADGHLDVYSTYVRGTVEERVAETDEAVAGADNELARLELSDGGDAHVEALLDGRQRAAQLLQMQVDDDDVTGRRADVRVLVLVINLHTHN